MGGGVPRYRRRSSRTPKPPPARQAAQAGNAMRKRLRSKGLSEVQLTRLYSFPSSLPADSRTVSAGDAMAPETLRKTALAGGYSDFEPSRAEI
jgi:hypothetical protein